MSLNHDYHPPKSYQTQQHRRRPRRLVPLLSLLLILLVSALLLYSGDPASESEAHIPPAELTAAPVVKAPPGPQRREISNMVQPGETASALLGDYFTPAEILQLSQQSKEVFPLRKICVGQPYKICTIDDQFESFTYEIDRNEQLIIRREGDQTLVEKQQIEYEIRQEVISGEISTSLFDAVSEIGEEAELAVALADIFAWDIDFILDIRVGDSFKALVEKRFRDGQPAGYGKVLAAEFVNQKKVFRAVLFADGDARPSYYDPDGNNVRKAFLKAPLDFTRISSGFTMKRFHPITKTWKSHPAIDYAAPTGTPIKSVGDGIVSRSGYTSGNGNFVEIRHNSSYTTLYLHMSKFGRGIKAGKRVSQGQVIGYVGSSGLATGPHLCFRMRKNGDPVNPNTVKVPAAKAVSKERLAEFKELAGTLFASFEKARPTQSVENTKASSQQAESSQ